MYSMGRREMKIEIYVNSERGVVKGIGRENLPALGYGGQIGRKYDSWHVKKAFVGLPPEEKELIDKLEHVAARFNVEFSVYDVAKTRHAFRAFFKGVRDTPTVIIGRKKLTGNITEEQLIEALEERVK